MQDSLNSERIPAMAGLLGLAGLIPFAACAAALWTGFAPPPVDEPARAMVAYGAVILSFLGGVRWGFALRMTDGGLQSRAFLLSVGPSIAAWLLLLAPAMLGLAAMPMLFLLLGLTDRQLPRIGAPAWYARLRTILTSVVVILFLAAVAAFAR